MTNLEQERAMADEENSDPDRPNAGARILVAEDDDDIRELIVTVLLQEGYVVYEAETGDELLRTIHSIVVDAWPSDGIDLVVMDINMPGISGLEALRTLRERRWPTPVILITALPSPQIIAEARRLGAPVLAKPFPLDKLSETARATLRARPPRQEPPRSVRFMTGR